MLAMGEEKREKIGNVTYKPSAPFKPKNA